jgi:cytochrome c biogenesis protein CcmG/thiol:disulfide interchange protein DsbE
VSGARASYRDRAGSRVNAPGAKPGTRRSSGVGARGRAAAGRLAVGRLAVGQLAVGLLAVGLLAVGLLAGCGGGAARNGMPAAVGGGTGVGTSAPAQLQACPGPGGPPARGDHLLPDLTLPCLGPGGAVTLRRLTGTPTVINIWASWCPPCRDELRSFEMLSWHTRGQVRVLGVVSEDTGKRAMSFAAETGVHFPSVVDTDGRLLRDLGRRTLPTTVFLDRTGRVVEVYNGAPLTSVDLRRLVRDRLGADVG